MRTLPYLPERTPIDPRERLIPETPAEERVLKNLLSAELPREIKAVAIEGDEIAFSAYVHQYQGDGWYEIVLQEQVQDPFAVLSGLMIRGRICVCDTGNTIHSEGRTEYWWEIPAQPGVVTDSSGSPQINYLPYLPVIAPDHATR